MRSFRLGCFLHWRSLGAIHRRNLERSPRHRPRRSWRPSPYGGKVLGRVTFTADGRMMSVVCDAGKSCRPECAGNTAPTAATTPVMARSLSPRLTRPQTRAVDTWGRFLFRVRSRSAPIETPTSGVFSGDFSYLLQFWPRSQFGADPHVRDRRCRRTPRAAVSMSLLWRPHDHHRDLRKGLPAKTPPRAPYNSDQDRHLIMPSPPIHQPSDARHSGWLGQHSRRLPQVDKSTRNDTANLSGNARCARSARHPHPS